MEQINNTQINVENVKNLAKAVFSVKLSRKTLVMDMVQELGKATWSQIHDFIVLNNPNVDTEDYLKNRSKYRGNSVSGITTDCGYPGYMLTPSKNEPRYLVKGEDGLYSVAI